MRRKDDSRFCKPTKRAFSSKISPGALSTPPVILHHARACRMQRSQLSSHVTAPVPQAFEDQLMSLGDMQSYSLSPVPNGQSTSRMELGCVVRLVDHEP